MNSTSNTLADLGKIPGALHDSRVIDRLTDLRRVAEHLFCGNVRTEIESDPEIEDESYVLFRVEMQSVPADALALWREWYRRTAEILDGDCDQLRLSIEFPS